MTAETYVSTLELDAKPDTSPWARRYTRNVLSAWGVVTEHIDTTELAVSELVSNAVKHTSEQSEGTPGRPLISLTVRREPTHLVVEVSDGSVRSPVCNETVAEEAESGRGLLIVAMVAKEWGCYFPRGGGKVVWFTIDLR